MAELVRVAHDAHGLDPAVDDVHREHAPDPGSRSAAGNRDESLGRRRQLARPARARRGVETESEKRVLIGSGGRTIKSIGTTTMSASTSSARACTRLRRGWVGDDGAAGPVWA